MLSERVHDREEPTHKDVARALAIAAVPIILILLQPDMGTVIIISASVVTIVAVSGAPSRWVVGLSMVAVLGRFGAVKAGVLSDYQVKRLQSFVNPSADPQMSGYQLRQSRITVGSGGLTGKGLFQGPQTNGRFVPEQQTDFIFTVAGEELGFCGKLAHPLPLHDYSLAVFPNSAEVSRFIWPIGLHRCYCMVCLSSI